MKKENSSFFKSVSVLTIGSIISMVFLAISHLMLPRIFSPEEMGAKSVILAIPMACIGILCGRYDLTLVYEEDESRIFPLIKLNVMINLGLSTLLTLVNLLYFVFFKPEYLKYWYTLPAIWIYLVAYGLTLTLNSYNNRYRNYKTISIMHALRTAAQSLLPVGLGLLLVKWLHLSALSVAILVVPYCVGMAVGLYSQGKDLIYNRRAIIGTDKGTVLEVARQHIRQPLLSAPAILANGFSYSLITLMTNALYDDATTGYYSLSVTLLGLPISLISGNMSKVYMKDASVEYEQTGCFRKAFRKNLLVLTAIAIPVFFAMFFVAPPICAWLFGSKWEIAGIYIKALAMMFSFRFITTALSPGLYICKKQNVELIIQIGFLAATALAGLLAHLLKLDSVSFMWLVGGARSLVMIVFILVVAYYARKPREDKKILERKED